MQEQFKALNPNTIYSTSSVDSRKPAHKGNANIIRNGSGEFVHPVAKIVKKYLHKIR